MLTFGADCFPRELSTPWHEDKLHPRDAVYDPFAPDLLFKESSRPFHWRTAVRTGFLRESSIAFDESLRLGRTRRSISRSILGQSVRCSFPTSSTNTG